MRKNNNRNILNGISNVSGLPLELLGSNPVFHMYSDNEIIIEGAKNIEHYDEQNVRILINKICLNVYGDNLCIKCLLNGNLSVLGTVAEIKIEHR